MVPRYIVQDVESGMFLCPSDDGDVTFTGWLHEAGRFDGPEEAHDTALMICGAGFYVSVVLDKMN